MERAIVDQVRAEVGAMTSYALSSGKEVSSSIVAIAADIEGHGPLSPNQLKAAVRAHRQLQAIVAPSLPRTVVLLQREKLSDRFAWFPSFGPIRLIRRLTGVSVLLMAALVFLSLFDGVNRHSGGMFDSHGPPLFWNLMFILAAAGLGGAFSGLFRASQYVSQGTYDPNTESNYWIRIILGLIAGLILAELIPETFFNQQPGSFQFARPVLALLGGFSATVVFRILQRLVDSVESVFRGDMEELVHAKVQNAHAAASSQAAEARRTLATRLLWIEQQIERGLPSAEVAEQIRDILDELVPMHALEKASDTPPGNES